MSFYNGFKLEELIKDFELHFPDIARYAERYELRNYGQLLIFRSDDIMSIYDWYSKSLFNFKEELFDNDEALWRRFFSVELRRLLKQSNMNQKDLSRLTGISEITISKYFNGSATPSAFNLKKMAKAFGVSVTEFTNIY